MQWINLEPLMQSEVIQKEKAKYSVTMHIYGIQKNGTEKIYLQGSNGETNIENKLMDMGRRGERVRCLDGITDTMDMGLGRLGDLVMDREA